MLKDKVFLSGYVKVVLRDKQGKSKLTRQGPNLVVDAGAILVAQNFANESPTLPTHTAIGDSSQAPVAGDTTLVGTELGRVALDSTTRTGNAIAYVATLPAGTGTGVMEEAGVFNASSGGTMLARFLTGTITKAAGDSLEVTWTLTMGT